MKIQFGKVTKVFQDNKFVVKFSIPEYIEDAIAYPINQKDEPNVGDPIVVFNIDSVYGQCFMYEKLKLKDYIRLKHHDSEIDIKSNQVDIRYGNSHIYLNKDGITIDSDSNINISSSRNLDINVDGNTNLNVEGAVTLTANSMKFVSDSTNIDIGGQSGSVSVLPCPYLKSPTFRVLKIT